MDNWVHKILNDPVLRLALPATLVFLIAALVVASGNAGLQGRLETARAQTAQMEDQARVLVGVLGNFVGNRDFTEQMTALLRHSAGLRPANVQVTAAKGGARIKVGPVTPNHFGRLMGVLYGNPAFSVENLEVTRSGDKGDLTLTAFVKPLR